MNKTPYIHRDAHCVPAVKDALLSLADENETTKDHNQKEEKNRDAHAADDVRINCRTHVPVRFIRPSKFQT